MPSSDATEPPQRRPRRRGSRARPELSQGEKSRQQPRGRRSGQGRPRENEQQRAARLQRRRDTVPPITYPKDLPVVAARDEIVAAIRDHQVVIVAGETGSGKTTQLPKICLELGRGIEGMIGHTQPRRIAARSVAERIAEELDVPIGAAVGYQVRFMEQASKDSLVKVMTDGILLAELQRDRELRRYDTLIIDEAHERSLNIDFILGYLRQLLPRRPDLKVIITSATIDPERFADHFAVDGVPAPIIEVSGRTFPVEVRYAPLVRTDGDQEVDVDQVTGIVDAVTDLWTEARPDGGPQDVLVFCSGEREIRDAADGLAGLNLPATDILPLYARLSAAEQHRVFAPSGRRRIVIATNVAETSLTVPGIRYVVDTGTARISRYSQRTKVQRLPIEPISQASARQRSGRCGRLADGIAIRLYSQDDFDARPEFTDPEILRTNLASVILQMTSLGLGDVSRFPFVEPPDPRQITDGVRLLEELGAVHEARGTSERRTLTAYGRAIAALPVDPRLARMLIAAAESGALREVLVIVAALSIQDPRERPADAQAQADQSHARFKHETSDFLSLLNLWRYLGEQRKALSSSAFRRMCKREYLHYLRIREWQDLHSQLKQACKQQDLRMSENPAAEATIHQAMLSGLLSHIGLRDADKRDYQGARGARFGLQPGSTLFRRQPDYVMSAELVETTRLWARTNAAIDPAWAEAIGAHLVKRQYAEPHWSRKAGSVMAAERVTLYGVPLVAGRQVSYAKVDPGAARELFIRHALVEGDWETRHDFYRENRQLVARLADLEARARRRDLLVDDEALFDFYDARIPESVVSAAHFDSWWKTAHRHTPDLLALTEDILLREDVTAVDARDYPKTWRQGDLKLRLTYQFEPGADADGVTVHLPVDQLNQVTDDGFDWLVPGVREELAVALLKSLPKATRRNFVPTPDHARRALERITPERGSLTDALAAALRESTGVSVPREEWDWDRVPDHLRMTFRVEDARGGRLAEGKDLSVLQEQLAGRVRGAMSRAGSSIERKGLTSWQIGDLPATFEQRSGRRTVQGFPALVDHGESVALEVLPTASERDFATRLGIRRLILLNVTVPWKRILALFTNAQRLALGNNPHGSMTALMDDVLATAVDDIVARDLPGGTVRSEADFDEALRVVRQQLTPRVIEVVEALTPVLDHARQVRLALDGMAQPSLTQLRSQLEAQLTGLVHPGFVAAAGARRLRDLDRYLRAMLERIDKAPSDLARDQQRAQDVDAVEAERQKLMAALPTARRTDPDVVQLRWLTEELRVSLFAQRLGTPVPVSPKRIFAAMDAVEDATT
ncbi:ATP-dependent RNA helicase HrpA [Rudaeicoccus suwonensis]|uniref:ATP-dependent helicase HrpA n=1 Tax=Rudaeicoccus suwonensis TaxID=657409 RepID=A0A561ECD0_9MICO|nr:ATP-dependent RNA helicase HrpA [Rudaeicoccus suwonensis]TWE13276.1 ATP-dependent helicase HrpA [Rudaeicoccus suwonensis]